MTEIYDENKKDSFYLDRATWQWYGYIDLLKRDIPLLKHSHSEGRLESWTL